MFTEDLYTLGQGNIEECSRKELSTRIALTTQHRQIFQEFLAGIRKSDDISDLVLDYGLDPDDYWEIVENNISKAIAENKSVEDAQWLLQKLARLQNDSGG